MLCNINIIEFGKANQVMAKRNESDFEIQAVESESIHTPLLNLINISSNPGPSDKDTPRALTPDISIESTTPDRLNENYKIQRMSNASDPSSKCTAMFWVRS